MSYLTTRVLLATFVPLYMYICLHTDIIDTWWSMNKRSNFLEPNKQPYQANIICIYCSFMVFFSYAIQPIFHAKKNQMFVSCVVPYVLCMASADLPTAIIFLIFDTND